MASTSKRRKPEDRISNLPTKLISHILSFMPTKDAVRTSVLSTRWNQQWATVTRLDIDEGIRYERSSTPASFVNFVYRALIFKACRLDLFRLKCRGDYGDTHFNDWLSAALSRHVQHIELMVHVNDPCCRDLSHLRLDCLFSSTTLMVLKLGMLLLLRVPKNIISLASLKILHFDWVGFEDKGESLSRLVSSCPVLEELKLVGRLKESMSGINILSNINISSILLKRLILIKLCYCFGPYGFTSHRAFEVVLNTPSLEYLDVDDHVPEVFHIETLHCLDRARLCMPEYFRPKSYCNDGYDLSPMLDLFVSISNVRFLYLSKYAIQALYYSCCKVENFRLPDFPRLTDLEIDGIDTNGGLSLLVTFLQRSRQLASLTFAVDECPDNLAWDQPTDVPFCMRYNLKVIEVKRFSGLEVHVSMFRYFLEKTNCLKELILPGMKQKKAEVIKEVLMLPRASNSCKIVFT